jgi:uncharacterized RDD family membrane protein YckC
VELQDKLRIETPEGVTLEVTLAGAGSRAGACLVDSLILAVMAFVILAATVFIGFADTSEDVVMFIIGIGVLLTFAVIFGYYLLFETLNGGRTPGKAAFGLRVIRLDGRPLGFAAVAVRTLLRFIDLLPAFYGVGLISILVTARNQRLGDLAAGTVVIADPKAVAPQLLLPDVEELPRWDVTAVTDQEVNLVRAFAERRLGLRQPRRGELAAGIAGRLRPKVLAPDPVDDDEAFILRLLAEKLTRQS